MKTWFYYSWLEDKEEESKKLKSLGCLIGSFWNPQGAKELMGEGVRKFESNDKDFEAAWQLVQKSENKNNKKRPSKRKK